MSPHSGALFPSALLARVWAAGRPTQEAVRRSQGPGWARCGHPFPTSPSEPPACLAGARTCLNACPEHVQALSKPLEGPGVGCSRVSSSGCCHCPTTSPRSCWFKNSGSEVSPPCAPPSLRLCTRRPGLPGLRLPQYGRRLGNRQKGPLAQPKAPNRPSSRRGKCGSPMGRWCPQHLHPRAQSPVGAALGPPEPAVAAAALRNPSEQSLALSAESR